MAVQKKTSSSAGIRNLDRHESGTYYVRISSGSKPSWKSLRTKVKSIAVKRLDNELKRATVAEELGDDRLADGTTMEDLVAIRLEQIDNDTELKPRTRVYWRQVFAALAKSRSQLGGMKPRQVSPVECERWAKGFSAEFSPTRFNNTLGGLRSLFTIAIEGGLRLTDPTRKIKRKRPNEKDLSLILPTLERFAEWVRLIRSRGGRFFRHSGDFVEALAYTGMRQGEAKGLLWKHCDFERGEILVTGDSEHGTKNHEKRFVPLIPAARELFERLRSEQGAMPEPALPILKVNEAQKSMDRAAEELGMERLTHHDLRHFFATICIESGVDIPTVAKWLGHKDGGVLAMKTYGHLRNEHSQAAAQKVSFAA